jgi:16S rRNA (cytosine967-C5)-methyltransferase
VNALNRSGVPAPGRRPSRPVVAHADPARETAWHLIAAWTAGNTERVVDDAVLRHLDPRDAGLVRELALGVARWQRLYDVLCAPFLRPGPQPIELRIALRLLCHQILVCDRIPPHAALHATVELVKAVGCGHLSGVVNAVGRRIAELAVERFGDGPLGRIPRERQPQAMGDRHSLTNLLVEDLTAVVPGDLDESLAALNRMSPLCTRTRPGRTLTPHPAMIRQDGPWTWWSDPAVALSGPVADGLCVVQDRAQGEVIEAARPRPLDLVLDVCAAPGGKAMAFADAGCRVVVADINPDKMGVLRRNLGARAALLAQDGCRPAVAAGAFDLVVVDAPCSNSGVLGRRPEARWRYTRENLAALDSLQREILAASAPLVAPGGRLIYSTCSLSPRENQRIAQALPGWRVLAERLSWPDAWQAGGYVAVLVRAD